MKAILAAALGAIVLTGHVAYADEQMEPLAQQGDWTAVAHLPSETSAPDLCVAINPPSGVGLRADGTDTTFRVINDHWSLPADVQGTITVTVGSDKRDLTITSNDASFVDAVIDPDGLAAFLDEIAKASSMQVKVGKDAPLNVSLSGSTVVLNAFRTCAGIGGAAPGGGGNPFQ